MISFVIPAYNEERLLGATLQALHAAARTLAEPYELIVVDDASTDGTAAVARAHAARVVAVNNRQIAATRNAGARVANGAMLVFVDADTLVDAMVLRAAIAALRAGAVGGGAGFRLDGDLPLWARVTTPALAWIFRRMRLAAGCFVFCWRSAFAASGGFDERLFASEELAFSGALKRQGRYVVLREAVLTSGRKARMLSGLQTLCLLLRLAWRGPAAVRQREGLELWYGSQREPPTPYASMSSCDHRGTPAEPPAEPPARAAAPLGSAPSNSRG